MRYIFNYSDGRNYEDSIKDCTKIETVKNDEGTITLNIFSTKKKKIEIVLDNKEAVAIAHSLLIASNSSKRIIIE